MLGDLPARGADRLGEALHLLRMSGAFYFPSELTAPWGLEVPPLADCLWFHVVTRGRGELVVDGAPYVLEAGDFALVPRGDGHLLRSDAAAATPSVMGLDHDFVTERYAILRHGGGGTPTTFVCGAVRLEHPAARGLIPLLPAVLHVTAGSDRSESMQATLRLMAAEAAELRPGGETVITRLSDILVIQAIRAWIETDPAARTGWLGALQDPQLGQVLAEVHRDPARPWTVASMADAAAMSRSAFAARFTELVGEPAMQYVTRWRMHTAYTLLADGGATVGELAGRLGYQSEAAFSRAFKRVVGLAPGAARRGASRLEPAAGRPTA
jgi:AraC-like DNA-binding protein